MVESGKAESEKQRPPQEPHAASEPRRAPQWVPYTPPKRGLQARIGQAIRRYAFLAALLLSLAAVVGVFFLYTPLQAKWGGSADQAAPVAAADPPPATPPSPYTGETAFSVTSQPAGASVVLGTDTLGRTPLGERDTRAGAYVLSVYKEGYAAVDSVVFLRSGQPLALHLRLMLEEGAAAGRTPEGEAPERREAGGEPTASAPPADRPAAAADSSASAEESEAEKARRAEQRRAERYQALRDEADRLYTQRKFEAAIEHYQAALRYRPGDEYATGRIQEIRKRTSVVGW